MMRLSRAARCAPAAGTAGGDHPSVAGDFWKPVDKALRSPRIQCTLCPRRCVLKDGQRGFCYVRQNVGNEMRLQTYGRSSGFAVDPVEKKPLNHFLPGTSILSFGTAGCNMGCRFCQNWHISKAASCDPLQTEVTPEGIAAAAVDHDAPSVAATYNDPVIFYEFARDTAAACRARGIRPVAVTAGYVTDEAREAFFDCFEATNVDLKGFTERFYKEVCRSHRQPVLDTLVHLAKRQRSGVRPVWYEITNLVIPGQNDAVAEVEEMCAWIAAHLGPFVPLHFTAFHPDFEMMDTPRTPPSTLAQCRDIAHRAGLKYVYVGNVHDDGGGQDTRCHACGTTVIRRDWFDVRSYSVTPSGACPRCDVKLPGLFAARPPRLQLAAGRRLSVADWMSGRQQPTVQRRPYRADMRPYRNRGR